jgi:phosphoglycolate phosphatase-like HAD superfamily hydrolase
MRACKLYSGLDGDQTLQIIAPDLERAGHKEILSAQGKLYENKYLRSVKAFEDVRQVFATLTRRGGTIALATDCKGPELKHYLSILDIDEFIEATACGGDVKHDKPDPSLVGWR